MTRTTSAALIADDDAYFGMAITGLLTRKLGFSDVLEVRSFDQAKAQLRAHPEVSLAILNLATPGLQGTEGLRALRESFPGVKIAVTSASTASRTILAALEARVHGYVPRTLSIADLTGAFQLVLGGGIYVPPALAEWGADAAPKPTALTPRQRDVLELLAQGKPNKEIAAALKLSEGTVKVHMAAIFRYFGVNNRAAAVGACSLLGRSGTTPRPHDLGEAVIPVEDGNLELRLRPFPIDPGSSSPPPPRAKPAPAKNPIARTYSASRAEVAAAKAKAAVLRRRPTATPD